MTPEEMLKQEYPYQGNVLPIHCVVDLMQKWHNYCNLEKNYEKINILEHARAILYDRSEEKERQYGPMQDCINLTSIIATEMSEAFHTITKTDVYNVLIALKLAREAFFHKEDNLLDAIVYMAALNDHKNQLLNKNRNNGKKSNRGEDR